MSDQRRWPALRVGIYVMAWLAISVPIIAGLFLSSERSITVASHDAVVSPTIGSHVTIRTGPFLPDVRVPSGGPVGVDLVLGKTEAGSIEEAVERYGFIASQREAQVRIVSDAIRAMAIDSAIRGGLIALVPIGVWLAIGTQRRRQLLGGTRLRRVSTAGLVVVLVAGVVVVVAQKPWQGSDAVVVDETEWLTLQEYLPDVAIPAEARGVEIQGTLTAAGTRRLVLSAIDTYQKSSTFYADARDGVQELELREPAEDETVAVLVSDRHDNIGMDPVVRAIGDRAGASAILDAGDDTSTGESWEAFSLDSLDDAFDEDSPYARYSVQGNHDHGNFVGQYLADRGWTTATNEAVDAGPLGRFASWDDPRSSGLGNWRDQTGLSIGELSELIADDVCDGERVNTLLVHDLDMGTQALDRGCVDLVVAGHVHVQTGPDPVVGENGEVGYRYTNGTTGGAAYAVAVGSKLRRAADVTLITYRDERPVGVQVVTLQTNGRFQVGEWIPLTYEDPEAPEEPADPDAPERPGPPTERVPPGS